MSSEDPRVGTVDEDGGGRSHYGTEHHTGAVPQSYQTLQSHTVSSAPALRQLSVLEGDTEAGSERAGKQGGRIRGAGGGGGTGSRWVRKAGPGLREGSTDSLEAETSGHPRALLHWLQCGKAPGLGPMASS